MKRLLTVLTVITLVCTMTTGLCFAGTGELGSGNEVPVILSVAGVSDGAGIDFTITDEITMSAAAGSTLLNVSGMTITNNASAGQLKVDSLEAAAEEGWTIKADDADYFAELKADTKEFSLVSEGNDFGQVPKKEFGESKRIAPSGGTQTFAFSGHIGTFRTAVTDTKVAEIIATISVY